MYGGVMTISIYILTLWFASLKAIILVNGTNPNISVVRQLNHFSANEIVNLNEINYRLAFIVENYAVKETKYDSRYVKYIAKIWTEKDGKSTNTQLPLYPCEDEDFA